MSTMQTIQETAEKLGSEGSDDFGENNNEMSVDNAFDKLKKQEKEELYGDD